MDALVEGLMEELNCETVFTIPLFGGIPVYESVVVTWIIMAVVFLLCILLSRNLSVENPSRRQVVVETAIKGLNDFFTETVGEKGKAYIPYLSAIAIYIGIANLIGLLGFKPPTKDMNVTATLALMSIVLIVAIGAGIAVLTGIGAGLGIGKATSSAVDAIARQPEAESKISKSLLLGCALAEATAIYGFVIALLIILFLG